MLYVLKTVVIQSCWLARVHCVQIVKKSLLKWKWNVKWPGYHKDFDIDMIARFLQQWVNLLQESSKKANKFSISQLSNSSSSVGTLSLTCWPLKVALSMNRSVIRAAIVKINSRYRNAQSCHTRIRYVLPLLDIEWTEDCQWYTDQSHKINQLTINPRPSPSPANISY